MYVMFPCMFDQKSAWGHLLQRACEPMRRGHQFCAIFRRKSAWGHHDLISQELSANRNASALRSVSRRSDGLGLGGICFRESLRAGYHCM